MIRLLRQYFGVLVAVFCLLLSVMPAPASEHLVNAAFKQSHIDLLPHLQIVENSTSEVSIELPGNGDGQKIRMSLTSRQSGQVYRWVVFTLGNPALVPKDLVITVPHQGFVSSRVLWPLEVGSSIVGHQSSSGRSPADINVRGTSAIAITIEPGATVSYALELNTQTIGEALLWQRSAFDTKKRQYSFFYGVMLGIAMFLALGFLCLFIVRQSAIFPSAGLFVVAAIGFIGFDAGYLSSAGSLPSIARWLPDHWQPSHSRAFIEILLLLGTILCATTFLDLRRRSKFWRAVFILLALASAGLFGLAWNAPHEATGIARIAMTVVVALGFILTLHYWLRGFVRAQATMLPWTVLLVWTALASVAALGIFNSEFLDPALAAGLVLVMVTMGFCLAQFAFDSGAGSYQFMKDTGRRALALAGSEQAVWDWQVADANLYVGPELERSLGLTPGTISGTDLGRWLELVHPADRAVYLSCVETAERRGKGSFGQDFRLRRADGSYRWFQLRARAMIGENGVAARLIGTLADVTADKRAEERLLSDAVRDRVTGLPNKALLLDRLQRAVVRARKQHDNRLYVLVTNLDRFKSINEALGHEIGDSILSITARRLNELAGPDDSVGRMPGDRFAVVFNASSSPHDIHAYTEAMRLALAQPVRLRDREVLLTASIGVAQFRVDRDQPEDLLKDAEIALYEAKRRGSDTVEFFRSEMREEQGQLIALEQDLHRAVARNEIEVVYQPLMRLKDDQLAGFEALARWRHPTEGLLEPASFMALAEETGIIRDIGRYVLNESARQLGIWQRAFRPHDPLFVSVNVSSAQLIDFELVTDVKNLLNREDIQPGTLKLELTETLVMQNPELSTNVLDRVRQLGIGLSCDDFGTGYSALANLARLPFDTLKVDRMFLEPDAEDERAAVILDTIILLAHDLKLTVVAEGVESAEQMGRLKELECDYAQGFFIGQPVTASQVLNALGGMSFGADNKRRARSTFWEVLRGHGRHAPVEAEPGPANPNVPPVKSGPSELPPVEPVAARYVEPEPLPSEPGPLPVEPETLPVERPRLPPLPASNIPSVAARATVIPEPQPLQWPPLPEVEEVREVVKVPQVEVAETIAEQVTMPAVEEAIEFWPTDADTTEVNQEVDPVPAKVVDTAPEPDEVEPETEAEPEPQAPVEPLSQPIGDDKNLDEQEPKQPKPEPKRARQRGKAKPRKSAPDTASAKDTDKPSTQKPPAAKRAQKPTKKRAPAAKKRTGQLKKKLRKAAKTRKAKST